MSKLKDLDTIPEVCCGLTDTVPKFADDAWPASDISRRSDSRAARSSQRRKRRFDVFVTLSAAPVWLSVLALCAMLILVLEGRPVFYVSQRQVGLRRVEWIMKFRTMKRDADKLVNRDTVPVAHTAFLNIPSDSPIYTPIGRLIERCGLTEIPQLLHVFSGKMSLIGSRPLPERVMQVLRSNYPHADERFLTAAGLSGPVQLIGRSALSDCDRLSIEAAYCRLVLSGRYRMRLDLWLLLYTVYAVVIPRRLLTMREVEYRMLRLARP
jgi:lipopolysaccharide/colanic/teichoic acid biosynthesis glycosyltransferase